MSWKDLLTGQLSGEVALGRLSRSESLCLEGEMEVAGMSLFSSSAVGPPPRRLVWCSGAQEKLKIPLSWVWLRVSWLEGGARNQDSADPE